MDNYALADQLTLLSKLMDIHGENPFKTKSYAAAAFTLEKLPMQVSDLAPEKITAVKGIGDSAGKKIVELLQTGQMQALETLLAQTPEGVLAMMQLKGLGPKKIHTLWKTLSISTLDALQEACTQNIIAQQKGFGAITQQRILEAIAYLQANAGNYLYIHLEPVAEALTQKMRTAFPKDQLEQTGGFRRQMDVVEKLEWVTTIAVADLKELFRGDGYTIVFEDLNALNLLADNRLPLQFYVADAAHFGTVLFETTGNDVFVNACKQAGNFDELNETEHEVFKKLGLPFIHPALRETAAILDHAKTKTLPKLIEPADVKGLIHAHSNWSDGGNTIEEMAEALIADGFEYLVLSDHSRAAFYANGLSEERIIEQHKQIDLLNKKYAPFKIFKSIECDILNDGEMDYGPQVLASFDLVIASIHSNLQMSEEKAMKRLLGAISNPYVSILGHMTGRLLTKRNGYPINHNAIIEACKKHNVVIEINASPQRLDMDWRYIETALQKGVTLSINPDAHALDHFNYIKYGVLAAQKGGLEKGQNVSSYSLSEFEEFVRAQQQKRPVTP